MSDYSNYLTIVEEDIPFTLKWKVEWRGMGAVHRNSSKRNLTESAFLSGSTLVGFTVTDELDKEHLVTIGLDTFNQSTDLHKFIMNLPTVWAMHFESMEHAEKFIEEINKRIAWNLLKRDYANR